MAYRKAYMMGHDIDWYGCFNGQWIYAASMGGFLPDRVNDDRSLPIIQMMAYNLPELVPAERIMINDGLIEERYKRAVSLYRDFYGSPQEGPDNDLLYPNERILNEFLESFTLESFKARYTEEFVRMAQKGFLTFIRKNIDALEDNSYALVAYPDEETIQRLTETLNSPLPKWLDYTFLQTYLQNISLQKTNMNPIQDGFNLWTEFS